MTRDVRRPSTHRVLSLTNVAVRGFMEAGIVASFGYWGYKNGTNPPSQILFAILAPALVFGFWGVVDFRFAGSYAETLRLAQELCVTALASAVLYTTGQHLLALLLLPLSLIHYAAVYLLGERLLKPRPGHQAGARVLVPSTPSSTPERP